MIQDFIVMACSAAFCVMTVPVIRSDQKPPIASSLTFMIGLFVMGSAFLTVPLVAAGIVALLNGALWGVVAVQTITPAAKLAWKHRG